MSEGESYWGKFPRHKYKIQVKQVCSYGLIVQQIDSPTLLLNYEKTSIGLCCLNQMYIMYFRIFSFKLREINRNSEIFMFPTRPLDYQAVGHVVRSQDKHSLFVMLHS